MPSGAEWSQEMKIAVITEGSTKSRNAEVIGALDGLGHTVYNLGMQNASGEPDLTYMETGFLSALVLNLGAVDFVVGGCGTGQGYMNAVLQFPGTACGLLCDPVDAFLFARVNAGNCISLALNKGYGNLAGDLNLRYIFEKLFDGAYGSGYPQARQAIQINARKKLAQLSGQTHRPMLELLRVIDQDLVRRALTFPGVADFLTAAPQFGLRAAVLGMV